MYQLLSKLEMPLLIRELKTLAASRRTYIVRFLYAAAIFSLSCLVFFTGTFGAKSGALGSGREMFRLLVLLQFWGMAILVPATTAGAITIEKERDALGVLMLTTLGSFRIVLQKLLSRLVPMFSFLLLGLPLLAVAYSYGGVTDDMLYKGIILLFLAAIHLGVISLFASCWSTTTTQALLQSWILFAISFFVLFPLWLPSGISSNDANLFSIVLGNGLVIGVLFLMSVICLSARAFATSQNFLLKVFQALDRFFNEANAATGGIVLVADQNNAPKMKPVAWRETARKSLGTFRYQFRVLTCLEVPILAICQDVRLNARGATPVQYVLYTLWCVTVLLVTVHGASLISSERSRQTLDVLLSTPMTGRSLITQKWAGLRRMLFVLFVPFVTIYAFQMYLNPRLGWEYLTLSIFSYICLMHTAAWLAIWIGLKQRSQIRAILTAIVVVGLIVVIPFAARLFLTGSVRLLSEAPTGLRLIDVVSACSPVEMILFIESNGTQQLRNAIVRLTMFLVIFGSLGLVLKMACSRKVDQRLGRVPRGFKMKNLKRPV